MTVSNPLLVLIPPLGHAPAEHVDASHLPMGVIRLPDQVVLSVNEQTLTLLGRTEAEVVGRHAAELVVPHESARTVRALAALSAGAVESYRARRTFIGGDGSGVATMLWVRSIPRQTGGLAVVTMTPVAEQQLLRRASRSCVGPLSIDLASGTLDDSGQVATIVRSDADVLATMRPGSGGAWPLVARVHPDDRPSLTAALHGLRMARHDRMVRLRVRHASLGWMPADLHLFATGDDSTGQPIGFILSEAAEHTPDAVRVVELERSLGRIAAELDSAGMTTQPPVSNDDDLTEELASLTERQREVVALLLTGSRVPTIALELYVSRSTIRNHLAAVYQAFGVHSQAELIERFRPARART